MSKISIMALGGLDEDGKNMTIVEIDDEILVIDCGLKYPETTSLGVEVIVPDFSYLIENKEKVKGIFITHGHDDVLGALPFLMQHIDAPIYAAPLTSLIIEDLFKVHKIKNAKIHRIKRSGQVSVGSIKVKTFSLTHSIPDTFGLAIWTDQGYIVHAVEYIIDFDLNDPAFGCDITEFAEIGKKGVFALLTESRSASRQGFTSPRHRVSDTVEQYFERAQGRIIITLYDQNIFRLLEVIDLANKFKRKIHFVSESQRTYLRHLGKLKYYHVPAGIEISNADFNNNFDNVVIIVSEQGPNVFRLMNKIAMNEHPKIQLRPEDSLIIASPVVSGAEKDAAGMENELYKDGVQVSSLDRNKFFTMHPSAEDLKMMINLFKPKHYIPLKGDYRQLVDNASIALNRGFLASHIHVLDNGKQIVFNNGEVESVSQRVEVEEILVDGGDILDASGLVIRDREILGNEGTMIIGVVVDFHTKEIIGGPDVQSRGVIYLKDADFVVKECGNIIVRVIKEHVAKGTYDNIEVRNEARDHMSKYVLKMTGKRPMILPVIIEINQS